MASQFPNSQEQNGSLWWINVPIQPLSNQTQLNATVYLEFSTAQSAPLQLPENTEWVIANPGVIGYFPISYSDKLWNQLLNHLPNISGTFTVVFEVIEWLNRI